MAQLENPRPATTLRYLLELSKEYQIDDSKILNKTGLSSSDLTNPNAWISRQQEIDATLNFAALAPNKPGLGVELANKFHMNLYGVTGLAIQNSPTIRAAIQTGIKYDCLSYSLADAQFVETEDIALISIVLNFAPTSVEKIICERQMTAMLWILKAMIPDIDPVPISIWLRSNDTAYCEALSSILGIDVQAGRACNALVIDSAFLSVPIENADAVTYRNCIDVCDEWLRMREAGMLVWTQKVRSLLFSSTGSLRTIESVSAELSVSQRTLRRRLSEEGTSYRDLRIDAGIVKASMLLETTNQTLDQIATELGYAETSSFTRVFAKRTGLSPRQLRNRSMPEQTT